MRTTPSVTEREFQAQVEDLCKLYGLRYYHTYDSRRSNAGFPDLVIVGKHAVLWLELKSPKGKVTEDQRDWLDDLNAAGETALVVRPCHLERINRLLASLAGRRVPSL